MTTPNLFDRNTIIQRRARATETGMFLQELARDEILERLEFVNRTFTSVAVVTGFPQIWQAAFKDAVIVPDDNTLNLHPNTFDLVIHSMGLHAANDPVGQLIQCKQALQPDGLFMGACFGGQTLAELRAALSTAESQVTGGLSPRISPMAEIRDLGAVMQRAGLALPVADNLAIPVAHRDLAGM
ncbi:MAG: methyltransferase domain-containing protein [Planktomarina sp.]